MRIVGPFGTVVVALSLAVGLSALCFSPAARAEENPEERAQALYGEGETAYAGGDYDSALASFNAAYELSAVPGLLFNIGQCHRKLGHHEEAADYFKRYLVEETDEIGNRAEVKELAAEESKLADAARAAAAANAPPVETTTPVEPAKPSQPQIYEEPVFWGVAGGVALAAIVGGVVLIAVASTPPPAGSLGTFDLRAQ